MDIAPVYVRSVTKDTGAQIVLDKFTCCRTWTMW